MVGADNDLDRIIGQLYELTLSDNEPWNAVMQGLVGGLGARTGWLLTRQTGGETKILGNVGVGIETATAYRDHYRALDPWSDAARQLPTGSIFTSHHYTDADALSRTEFYADFVRPNLGDTTWGLGTTVPAADGGRLAFVVHRLRAAGAFTPTETEVLRRIMPHLRNAALLRHRVGKLVAERDRALDVLAAVQCGALVLDRTGCVKFVSPAAEEMLRAQDGLRLTIGGVQAGTRTEQVRLDQAIGRASDLVAPAGTMLRVSRPSGAADWALLIAPLSKAARSSLGDVLCLIRDLDRTLSPSERHLISAFGLTAAEARVATAIAQGKSLEMIADEFGVSRNTVRNQAQQVLLKAGADRQAQLVRLILSLPVARD